MMTESKNGCHYVYGEKNSIYGNAYTAMWAGSHAQMFYAQEGFLTSMTINLGVKKVELTVHFDKCTLPPIPEHVGFSYRTLSSHTYWSDYRKVTERVRTATFTFNY